MKKILFFLFTIVLEINAFSYCRIDTSYNYDYTSGSSVKNLKGRSIYSYNNNDDLTFYLIQNWQAASSQWVNSSKQTRTYDVTFNEILSVSEIWNTTSNSWVNENRTTNVFNAQNLRTDYMYEVWNTTSSHWDKNNRITTSFNGAGSISVQTTVKGDIPTDTWVNFERNTYTYDVNNNQTSFLKESWNTITGWEFNARKTSTFDTNNKEIQNITQNYSTGTGQWVNLQKTSNTFSSTTGDRTYSLLQDWNTTSSNWDDYQQYFFSYNSNHDYTNYYSQYRSGAAWVNNEKSSFIYDANRLQLQRINQKWNNGTSVWVNQTKTDNTYTPQQKLLENASFNWSTTSNTWQNNNRTTYDYAADGFQLGYDLYLSWNTTTSAYNTHLRYENRCARNNVGIDIISEESNFSFYPNPLSAQNLTINSLEEASFLITDMTGKIISTGELQTGENNILLQDISAGIYLLKVGNSTKRFIKN